MKILFISGNLCDGGAQRVISVVASGLAERGHDVSLLLFSRNENEYPVSRAVNIVSLGKSYQEYSAMSAAARLRRIRAYLKELAPDAAVGFLEGGYALYLASVGMRFAKIASARIDPKFIFNAKGLRAVIDRAWFCNADAVVVQTESQTAHVPKGTWKNMTVIANPVSDAALTMPEHDYERPCKRIVMAGRLAPQKNYPLVFRAMQLLRKTHPELTLDIYGKGSQGESLSAMLHEMGLEGQVFLRGWCRNTLAEYESHDIFILSSDYEGMPNALMEAMAAGLPCISTNCDTGPSDLIKDGENGFLVPVNDPQMMADRLSELLSMEPESRKRLGVNARDTIISNYNSKTVTEKWEALLQETARRKR